MKATHMLICVGLVGIGVALALGGVGGAFLIPLIACGLMMGMMMLMMFRQGGGGGGSHG